MSVVEPLHLFFDQLLRTSDVLAVSLTIGAPVWVFFIQGPALFQHLGRQQFLSPMMRLTSVLFQWTLPLTAAFSLLFTLARQMLANEGHYCKRLLTTRTTLSALLALIFILINSVLIVPRALQAGKRALAKNYKKKTDDAASKDVADFAVSGGEGGAKSGTKALHQTVVVFVALHLVASVFHAHTVITNEDISVRC